MKKRNKTMKRGFTLLLTLALCMSMSQVTAFAADDNVPSDGIESQDTEQLDNNVSYGTVGDANVGNATTGSNDSGKQNDNGETNSGDEGSQPSTPVAGNNSGSNNGTGNAGDDTNNNGNGNTGTNNDNTDDVTPTEEVCPDCKKPGGGHWGTCSQNSANQKPGNQETESPKGEKCAECGGLNGKHSGTCPQNSINQKPGNQETEIPKGEVCTECGELNGKHSGTCPQNPANKKCDECGSIGGHTEECTQNPNNQNPDNQACEECGMTDGKHSEDCSKNSDKPEPVVPTEPDKPDAPYSFNVTVGNGTSSNQTITELTRENVAAAIPDVIQGEDGKQYVLDEVISDSYTWYRPNSNDTVDKFYGQASNLVDSNLLPKDFVAGKVNVSYALDENGDGIADKYQATIRYENVVEEGKQFIEKLGYENDGILIPNYGTTRPLSQTGSVNLQNVTPAVPEGKTFADSWTITNSQGESVYKITKEKDDAGNTLLIARDHSGNIVNAISSANFAEGTELNISMLSLTLKGGDVYTVSAEFADPEKDPDTTDPEEPGTTDPEEPGTTDPEEPGTADPEEPGTTDPEEPQAPGTADTPAAPATPAAAPAEFNIPDEVVPLAAEANEIIIADEAVPLAGAPAGTVILDEDVPLAGVPQTGDISIMWYLLTLLSAAGLLVMTAMNRSKEQ